MTELLMIKEKEDYFRFTDNGFLRCELAKGSVYPLDRVAKVKKLCAALRQDGIIDARLIKLTITESPYQE